MKDLPAPEALIYGVERRQPAQRRMPPRPRAGEKFLKGPIPFRWLGRAGQLPGKSLHVGIALWFMAGITRNRTVPLANKTLAVLGVDRYAKYRALVWLEGAGLVSVERRPGCNPVVTLHECGDAD
jgi:hypothetical protein